MSEPHNLHGFRKVGADVIVWPEAKIINRENISIGDSVIIDDFVFISGGKNTEIGSFVHIASFVSITGGGELIMEDFSNISAGCRVLTGTDDFLGDALMGPTLPEKYRNITRSFIHMKKHSILGANVVVLPGVTIGEGASVGANSLVTKDCEAWTHYVGTPAKPVRARRADKILALETDLRNEIYDASGGYIPKSERTDVSP